MDKTVIMGIENEFTLLDQTRDVCDGREHFKGLIKQLNGHYFRKSATCVRLHTGGSFYIDEISPEITTTPFDLRKDGITALVENLFMQTGVVLEALHYYNQHLKRKSLPFQYPPYCLQGYSAHYSFTFPVIPPYRAEVTKLLAETVNPVVQLFLENRQSRGVMYRYVDIRTPCDRRFYNQRVELCGDYIYNKKNVIAAVAFQAAMLWTIDDLLEQGLKIKEIRQYFNYSNLEKADRTESGDGHILRTPEVIKKGRRAKLDLRNAKGHYCTLTTQQLLEHYFRLFQPAAEFILSPEEFKILEDSVYEKRRLPIDYSFRPPGYERVRNRPVDHKKAWTPLTKAYGNMVEVRNFVEGNIVRPLDMSWDQITLLIGLGSVGTREFTIPREDLILFDQAINTESIEFRHRILEERDWPSAKKVIEDAR